MVPRASAFVRTVAVMLTTIMIAGPAWASAAEGTASAAGDLSVDTDPIGAAVYVDGRLAGATPVTVPRIAAGEHRVRVVKNGYLDNARVITVAPRKPTAVKVKMTRSAETSADGQVVSTGSSGGGGGLLSNKWLWVAVAAGGGAAAFALASKNAAPSPGTITAPANALMGTNVRFSASGASDPEGDALTLTWDFGDGGTATGATVTHAYTRTGAFTVTLTVSDAKHKITAPTATVNVKSLTATWRGPLRASTTFNTVVPLTHNGTSLTGSYSDQTGGSGSTVTGSIDPATGAVTFTVTIPGFAPFTFSGTADADVNTLNGVANGSGFASAAWTMTRG